MNNNFIDVPVLLVVYNREAQLKEFLNAVKDFRIKKLYIYVDGPKNNELDREKCSKVKNLLLTYQWVIAPRIEFNKKNMGCSASIINAIDWVFSHEDRVILFEDDCIPAIDFFKFCQCLLDYYENDNRIMGICGSTVTNNSSSTVSSYYFSRFAGVWGMAIWKRSWDLLDRNMNTFDDFVFEDGISAVLGVNCDRNGWYNKLLDVKKAQGAHGWDYLWTYSVMINNGLFIYPYVNLIKNIGYEGVHKSNYDSQLLGNEIGLISTITHPKLIIPSMDIEQKLIELHQKNFLPMRERIRRIILQNDLFNNAWSKIRSLVNKVKSLV